LTAIKKKKSAGSKNDNDNRRRSPLQKGRVKEKHIVNLLRVNGGVTTQAQRRTGRKTHAGRRETKGNQKKDSRTIRDRKECGVLSMCIGEKGTRTRKKGVPTQGFSPRVTGVPPMRPPTSGRVEKGGGPGFLGKNRKKTPQKGACACTPKTQRKRRT